MKELIALDRVALTYPGPPPVSALRPTSLLVPVGDYVAVVGRSGAGKSTLLNVIGLLDRPTEGTYLFGGVDVQKLTERDRTALRGQRIGFVFQAFNLLPYRTATENVAMAQLYCGLPKAKRLQAAREALSLVGLDHRRDALPVTMSGGERQRVAIARAVVHKPELLLCDEPTGNLDSENAQAVMEILDRFHAAGVSIMVITHDHTVATRARRSVMMSDGSIVG